MKKEDLKHSITGIQPSVDLKARIERSVMNVADGTLQGDRSQTRVSPPKGRAPLEGKSRAPFAAAAAGIVLVAAVGIGFSAWDSKKSAEGNPPVAAVSPSAVGTIGPGASTPANSLDSSQTAPVSGAVTLPKIKLPENSGVLMDMIGLFVYKGHIYTQAGTKIAPELAETLRGEKLGRTKGGIDEWSKQEDYATEFAATIGETDIYTVKGYDPGFRLMGYQMLDGQVYAELYENLNDRVISSGADLFDLLQVKGRVASADYLPFDSWNNGIEKLIPLTNQSGVDAFVDALYSAKPLEKMPLVEAGLYDNEADQAFLRLHMKDGSEVELRLFKPGYVSYGMADVIFQVDASVFDKVWNELQALN
ncbi:hypothetical protein [Gorillibacterium timonense]|uniref:hypothetical protein n=1 Tax=Gorillibacterium timonense TaxID=1689269 RepID=UPI00071E4629|nr:hypothetical protein [Gorillibacterium timonense]